MASWIWGSSTATEEAPATPAASDGGGGVIEVVEDTRTFDEKLEAMKTAVDAATGSYPFLPIVYKRFLNGYKGVCDSAIKGLIRHWEWRLEVKADTLTAESCDTITAKNIAIIHGQDRDGRPVVSVIVGNHDKDDRDINQMKNFIVYNLERLMKISDPESQKISMIFDMGGFGFKCMDYETVQILIAILQKNYPEVLTVVLIVNSPFIFWACWAIIKPWIDPVTQKKIEFIDAKTVVDYVAVDQLLPEIKESLKI